MTKFILIFRLDLVCVDKDGKKVSVYLAPNYDKSPLDFEIKCCTGLDDRIFFGELTIPQRPLNFIYTTTATAN